MGLKTLLGITCDYDYTFYLPFETNFSRGLDYMLLTLSFHPTNNLHLSFVKRLNDVIKQD